MPISNKFIIKLYCIIIITLYHFIIIIRPFIIIIRHFVIYTPIEPNSLRAFLKACFFNVCLAAEIEPVLDSVLEAASMAVVHFLPVLLLPPLIFLLLLVLFFLESLWRLVDIYILYTH